MKDRFEIEWQFADEQGAKGRRHFFWVHADALKGVPADKLDWLYEALLSSASGRIRDAVGLNYDRFRDWGLTVIAAREVADD